MVFTLALDSRLAWSGHRCDGRCQEATRSGSFLRTRPKCVRFRKLAVICSADSVETRSSKGKAEEPPACRTDAASFLRDHMRDERTTREHRQPVTADRLPDMIAPYRICGCAHPAGLGLNVPVSPWEADLLLHASPGAGSSVTQTRELERACDKDLLSPDVSEAKSKSEGEGPGLSDSYLLAASPAWDEGECERFLSQELGGETELSGKHGNLQTAHAQREPAQGGLEEGETASMEEASSKAMDDYRRRAVVMWAVGEAMAHEVMGGSRGEGTHRQTDTNGTDDGEARMEEHGEHARQHTRWQSHRHTRPLEQRHAVGFDKRVG